MAKTYILEPTELNFVGNAEINLTADLKDTSLYGLTADEIKNLIPDGSILDINNGDKFITVGDDSGVAATRDGAPTGETTEEFASFSLDGLTSKVVDLYIISKTTTEPGTYTVSIYTETEAADPYPVKNFTYEHTEVAKNDIEEIIQAIYTRINEPQTQQVNGHSPADRLVVAVAKLRYVDPEKALTTGNYPNQMKRIAAIIRGDFGELTPVDG